MDRNGKKKFRFGKKFFLSSSKTGETVGNAKQTIFYFWPQHDSFFVCEGLAIPTYGFSNQIRNNELFWLQENRLVWLIQTCLHWKLRMCSQDCC